MKLLRVIPNGERIDRNLPVLEREIDIGIEIEFRGLNQCERRRGRNRRPALTTDTRAALSPAEQASSRQGASRQTLVHATSPHGKETAMSEVLEGKSAFVTAAGQGIGRATAIALAAAGARVIATDVDEAKLRDLAGGSIRIAKLDVLHASDIDLAARDAGPVDILFNCAGFVPQGTVLDATE